MTAARASVATRSPRLPFAHGGSSYDEVLIQADRLAHRRVLTRQYVLRPVRPVSHTARWRTRNCLAVVPKRSVSGARSPRARSWCPPLPGAGGADRITPYAL